MSRPPMGGGGGGGMLKTVHKAVRAGSCSRGPFQEPFNTSGPTFKSSSSDNNNYSFNNLSFSSGNHHYSPSTINLPKSSSSMSDHEFDDYVFCTVPSTDEVHHALYSLQHVLDPRTSSSETVCEFEWIEPSTSMFHSSGAQSVYDAFHLLQTEPSVKRMVMSLSSDKSVWDAVMNNEAVLELRNSIREANNNDESSDGSISVSDVINWIFINTRAKVMEIVLKTAEMVHKLFLSSRNEKKAKEGNAAATPIEKKLRSSFLLTVMVLLIVVVSGQPILQILVICIPTLQNTSFSALFVCFGFTVVFY